MGRQDAGIQDLGLKGDMEAGTGKEQIPVWTAGFLAP